MQATLKTAMTMSEIPKEQRFLETYFLALAQFSYDKARDLADKERDGCKNQITAPYNIMLNSLSQFAVAEKSYMYLLFLAPKGFLRKDSTLKSSYETLKNEFKKIEDIGKVSLSESLEKLFAHLCDQLVHFIAARLELMELYQKAYNMGISRNINRATEELLANTSTIAQNNHKNFHHPYLINLKNSFSYEVEILDQLFSAQLEIQQYKYLQSLLHLHEAHCTLCAWGSMSLVRESRRFSFGSSFLKSPQMPALYQWLLKLKGFLISKFTFYFHEILSKQTIPQEMKSICTKAPIDFYQKLSAFQRKSDALCITLILDSNGIEYTKGQGYLHPARVRETLKGLDSFPAVVTLPPSTMEKPFQYMIHWPNIVMIMGDKAAELNTLERTICFHDQQVHFTYFLSRVDPRMTLVFIFNGKKSDKESYITVFLEEFCRELRFSRILASLKPGSK